MDQKTGFVLVHSPLVSARTWANVAEILACDGPVAVPELSNDPGSLPYWKHHSQTIALAASELTAERVALVAHSGAGPLMPVAGALLKRAPLAYLFVDAIIPSHGKSRLDLFDNDAERAAFRAMAREGVLPAFGKAMLTASIANADLRAEFAGECRATPLAIYEEPIPVPATWPDAPCAYLQFSPIYDRIAAVARERGWPCDGLCGSHFHMLNDPQATVDAILSLIEKTARRETVP
jgi:hypothetical protein